MRILRLIKLFRFTKKNSGLSFMKVWMNLSSSNSNMLGMIAFVLFLTHLIACLFFLQAKWQDFDDNCWVVQEDMIGESVGFQYTLAAYWALQTLTTVGFGDITIKTVNERLFAICWMILGVAFYSYAIGNMTNMIASMDADREQLNQKLSVLKEFKQRTSMPIGMYSKIKRHLENNQRSANSFAEQDKILNDLPQQLKNQIIECTHGEIIDRIDFFKDKEHEFLYAVMPELKPLKLLEGDVLYQ